MKNELFDHLIKSRVSEVENAGKPDWQRMSALIDQWEAEEQKTSDAGFDAMIASKLKQSVAYSEGNWSKLEKEIDRRRTIKQRIVLFQLSAAAVVVLMAMLTFQMYPYFTDTFRGNGIVHSEGLQLKESTLSTDNGVYNTLRKRELQVPEVNNAPISQNPETMHWSFAQPGESIDKTLKAAHINSGISQLAGLSIGKIIAASNPGFYNPFVNVSYLDKDMNLNSVSFEITIYEKIEGSQQIVAFHKVYQNDSDNLQSAGFGSLQEKSTEIEKTNQINVVNPVEDIKALSKPEFYVAAYHSPGVQLIQSPFDQVFNEPGYDLKQPNAGVGISAGMNYQRFGFNTGLEYGNLEYSPRKVEESIGEGKSIYLKNVALKTIRVPFHFSYSMFKDKIWEIYCKAGISINAVLEARYDMEEKSDGLAYLIENLKTNPSFVNSLYSAKSFESGLLDKGELVPNVASSADFGVGIKRHVSKDAYVFIEPMVHYDMLGNGLGPNKDIIHNVHMKTGLAVNLN